MIRNFLLFTLLAISNASYADYKCKINGIVTYSEDETCKKYGVKFYVKDRHTGKFTTHNKQPENTIKPSEQPILATKPQNRPPQLTPCENEYLSLNSSGIKANSEEYAQLKALADANCNNLQPYPPQ